MPLISSHGHFEMNRNTFTCLAIFGAGVACVGASTFYFYYRVQDLLQRELSDITRLVSDIRRDISELKASSKRRGLAAGSSFSDETSDVYYDFTDDGETSSIDSDDESKSSDDHSNSTNALEVDSSFNPVIELPVDPSVTKQPLPLVADTSKHRKGGSRKSLIFRRKMVTNIQDGLEYVDEILEILAIKPNNYERLRDKVLSLHDQFYTNYEYLWRVAKACHQCGVIAEEHGNPETKREYMQEALKYASAALALTDDDANVHKWYAICTGSCAEFQTIQTKIKFGFTVKEHAQLALKLNPEDESLYYLMGRWCYEVATMSWIERKVATTIFGEIPSATILEARDYFLTAQNRRKAPSVWKENLLYLAKTYIAEREYNLAVDWLDKASENYKDNSVCQENPLVLQEIENLKAKYGAYRT